MQPAVASAGADFKGSVVQEEAPGAATEQTEEEGPTSHIAEAHESDGAKAPPVAEAGSKAEAPRTPEVEMVEVCVAGPVARDSEMEVGQPLVLPLAQGLPPSLESAREVEVQATPSDDTSRGKEAADVEAASAAEQLVLASGEGNSALARVRPEPRGWNHPRISWLSQDDPEGEPLFALEDAVEGGAGAPSSNIAGWRCSRCERHCPSWTTICPTSSRYASSFLVRCCLVLSLFAIHDPCSTYPGARGLVSREVVVPSSGEGRLGPAPVA